MENEHPKSHELNRPREESIVKKKDFFTNFYVLLTVHLSIILVINQLNAQILVLK